MSGYVYAGFPSSVGVIIGVFSSWYFLSGYATLPCKTINYQPLQCQQQLIQSLRYLLQQRKVQ